MNLRLVIALLCLSEPAAFSQGQLLFDNRVSGVVVAPIYGPAVSDPESSQQGNTPAGFPAGALTYEGSLLSGQDYSAQLFGGSTNTPTDQLQALLPVVHFRLGTLAGFIAPPEFALVVPGVPEGSPAKVQLRAWHNDGGRFATWNDVQTNGWIARGVSQPFITDRLGRATLLPPNLDGLRSFNLSIPPGVAALLPPTPQGFGARTVSDSIVELSWQTPTTPVLGFRLEHSLDGIVYSVVTFAGPEAITQQWQNLRPGVLHRFRMRAFNAAGESSYSPVASALTKTPYAQWRSIWFAPSDATNDLISGEAADPDGDDLPNFSEYVFTANPLQGDRESVVTPSVDRTVNPDGLLTAVYQRNRSAIDARVQGQVSGDLVSWQKGSNHVTGPLVVSETQHTVTEMFRDNTPVSSAAQRAIQLQAVNVGLRDVWQAGASMPVALEAVACGVIGQRLYVVGGGSPVTLAYDFTTRLWTNLAANRPFPASSHAAEVINNRLYLLGGTGVAAGRMQIYDPVTNGWSIGPPLPFMAGPCATAVIEGRIYLVGPDPAAVPAADILARFDVAQNRWTNNLARIPHPRVFAAAGTDGTFFFLFGGRSSGSTPANDGSDTVQIYNPAINNWISSGQAGSWLAPLPQARSGMGKAVYLNGLFFVMGGETTRETGATADGVYNRVDIYDFPLNRWSIGTPMPTARHGIFPVLHEGRVHVAGGGLVAGSAGSSVFEIYSPP